MNRAVFLLAIALVVAGVFGTPISSATGTVLLLLALGLGAATLAGARTTARSILRASVLFASTVFLLPVGLRLAYCELEQAIGLASATADGMGEARSLLVLFLASVIAGSAVMFLARLRRALPRRPIPERPTVRARLPRVQPRARVPFDLGSVPQPEDGNDDYGFLEVLNRDR